MIFCFWRRKTLTLLTCLIVFLLIFTVAHFKSPAIRVGDDIFSHQDSAAQAEEAGGGNGNSWRLVSHEIDEGDEVIPRDDQPMKSAVRSSMSKVSFHRISASSVTTPSGLDDVAPQEKPRPHPPPGLSTDGARYIPPHRVVHLDLKGAPPKLSYLKSIFPLLREAGATALLIEYEDMFPFWGPLRNISAKNCYSRQDVQALISWANQNDLEVIPLIQTFGHLEFVLKLEEFKELREAPLFPQSLCPSKDKSWELVTQIMDQVLSLHPDSKWLHIGCDEVYQLGQCPLCSERIGRSAAKSSSENSAGGVNSFLDVKMLFLEHVKRVANYVRQEKKIIPIIWDDMLRSIPSNILKSSEIGPLVEPMVWVYIEDIDRFVDSVTWSNYGQVFQFVWTASAFKGAFGERMFSANIQRHAANQLSWLEVMKRETTKLVNPIIFRGIVLTGWSRYDHFAVLCELLPAALPSLVLCLAITSQGGQDFEAVRKTHRVLQCTPRNQLLTPDELRRNPFQWDLHRCRFPGSNFYGLLSSYRMNLREVESISSRAKDRDGWMTDYNVDHKFSSPLRVRDAMKSVAYLPGSLRSLEVQVEKTLSTYFDHYTVEEWIEQHIRPMIKTIDELNKRADLLTSVSSWPRRPLNNIDQLTDSDQKVEEDKIDKLIQAKTETKIQ